jgi:caa(3)-type oxidase subunit IV
MERVDPVRLHLLVWLVLLLLTGINIALSQLRLGFWYSPLSLLIAALQAVVIAVFLMHLRWSPAPVRIVALAALLWLAILIVGTLDDVLTRGWLRPPGA